MKIFGYTIAVLAAALMALAGSAFAGSVPIFGGPGQSNPINQPAVQADMNNMINQLNVALGAGLTTGSISSLFTSGSINGQFQSTGFAKSGTSLTTGTLVPYNTVNTTAKFFLTFVDSQGIQSFIPVWQ